MAPGARAKTSPENTIWAPGSDLRPWLREALVPMPEAPRAFALRHAALRARMGPAGDEPAWEVVPPIRGRRVLAMDPGFKSGCKLAALDEFKAALEPTPRS